MRVARNVPVLEMVPERFFEFREQLGGEEVDGYELCMSHESPCVDGWRVVVVAACLVDGADSG